MPDLKFRVKAKSVNATKTIVKARGFEMIVDEPAGLGGTDEGANPVEYILAAYAGCLNVMAHVCAPEFGITLRGVEIDLQGNLNPNRLFGKSFEDRAGYKGIKVVLKADCDADDATLDLWIKDVVNRCPVGDNLKNTTDIVIKVKRSK
ncbi:MAG: osmotically inducible protein C [Flavobacteriaceae bacterium]|nr:MAG: osmotically inducible protein C [Flavobacteriaceae bacterium]